MLRKRWFIPLMLMLTLIVGVSGVSGQESTDLTIAQILLSGAEDGSNPLSTFGQIYAFEDWDTMQTLLNDPNSERTIFVPTNQAIAEFLEGPMSLPEVQEMSLQLGFARNILEYHVGPDIALTFDDLLTHIENGGVIGGRLATRQGQILNMTNEDGAVVIDGHATILREGSFTVNVDGNPVTLSFDNLRASNGVIHVIDSVIFPTIAPILTVLEEARIDF